jgi:hypothetical protein
MEKFGFSELYVSLPKEWILHVSIAPVHFLSLTIGAEVADYKSSIDRNA